jgi:predicted dehydrogenase
LEAATVAVPTVHHLPVASELIEGGVAVLVEKPLAASPKDAHTIDDLAKKNGVTLQVGHTERFNPAVRRALAMHVTPRYIEIDRVSPMTFRSLDIGVVMDLMIHDLDIVLAMAQSPLARIDAVGVVVVGKNEDVANARLIFKNGCVASLTASRLALQTKRKMRLFSEDAYVSLDYQAREGVIIRRTDNNVVLDEVRYQIESGADLTDLDYTDLITVEPLAMDDNTIEQDPLTAQARSFLSAVRTGSKVEVDGSAGCAAVEAAQQVVQAVAEHKWEGMERV